MAQPGASGVTEQEREAIVGDGLLTVREAAAFLRLSKSTLYGLMEMQRLAYVKIGRARRIPRRALVDLAAHYLVGGENK